MNMQISLFETESPALQKGAVRRSACIRNWIAIDGRMVFEAGKKYAHANTSELAIKGENGIVMWMSNERFRRHFA